MTTIRIKHTQSNNHIPQFEVQSGSGQSTNNQIQLTSPTEKMVGATNKTLIQGLQWYLEEFFTLPITNYQTHANEVQTSLKEWGRDCFNALFTGQAQNWYNDAWRNGLENLTIKVASDTPDILAWPWEALFNDDDGYIAQHCRIERELHSVRGARPIATKLSENQLNILYIIARPYGDSDVGFQTLARPLIDFVATEKWPVRVDVLRPPTFDQLRAVLEENKNFYHIVHFDGHGGAPGQVDGQDGVLLFEKDNDPNNEGDAIPAERLSTLLREYNVPYMVLNACLSATMGSNPFASVATSLLKAGAHGVVAMSHSLWVNGAKAFVPAFYKRLFVEGDIAEATRAGRREMYNKKMRDAQFGQNNQVEFNDWVVPVLYHQVTEKRILPKLTKGGREHNSRLPAEARQLMRRDFIGRSGAIHQLERAIKRQPQAGILVHGMAGEGKTTLARGFLQWLDDTGGLETDALWFSFEGIYSASYVIDVLTERLFGLQAMAATMEDKIPAIIQKLNDTPLVMVWDNFESVSGYGGVTALLSEDDRDVLKRLLRGLRGGATKVIITSRSPEAWLETREVFRLKLDGLQGEELWQYCNAVVRDLGLSIARNDPEYKPLIDKLQGNPLAIRVILLRLEKKPSPKTLMAELEKGEYPGEDDDTKRLLQALEVFSSGLDEAFAPVLRFIGLHEQFVDADYVGVMLNAIDAPVDSVAVCFDTLVKGGLCHEVYENGYKIHPAMRASLTKLCPATELECRAFVDFIGTLCCVYGEKQMHEKRMIFELFSANFHSALSMARGLDMQDDICMLLDRIAVYAYYNRHFAEAEQLYRELLQAGESFNRSHAKAAAYHQLGMIATKSRDFEAAEKLYKHALEINLKQGNGRGAATIYHQMGILAEERRDFEAAEKLYQQSLEITLKQDDDHGATSTYHQLGMLAQERRDFEAAEKWYQQSLDIELKRDDDLGAATTYHQMGTLAQERRDFEAAEKLYKQSLEIKLKQGDDHGTATTYHQLGMLAEKRRDFEAAEKWYKHALEIDLKQGNDHGTATTYHQMGRLAEERRDFDAAEKWYMQAMEIDLNQGNDHGAAITYAQLGLFAGMRQDFDRAEAFTQKALDIFIKNDPFSTEKAQRQLQLIKSLKEDQKK